MKNLYEIKICFPKNGIKNKFLKRHWELNIPFHILKWPKIQKQWGLEQINEINIYTMKELLPQHSSYQFYSEESPTLKEAESILYG